MDKHDEFSYWNLSSGLPLDGAEVVVTDACFEFDTSYNADAVVAKLTYAFLNGEGDPQTQMYSVGKNWEPVDGGSAVAHTSGKRVGINKGSNYGVLVGGLMSCEGADKARAVANERGMEPDHAGLWTGMKFRLKNVSRPNNIEGAKKATIDTLIPAEFLGVDDASAPVASGAKGSSATSAAGAKSGITGISAATMAELNALAQSAADFDTFMEQAMEIDGVAGNKAAEKAVMSSKAGSIWALNQ